MVSDNQYSEISTYFKDGMEWSTIKVAETVPEGVMIVNFGISQGNIAGIHGISTVDF